MKVEWVPFGEVFSGTRTSIQVDPTTLYSPIGVRSHGRGVFRYPATIGAELPKLNHFRVTPGSLFISNIKAWEGAVAIAPADNIELTCTSRFLQYSSEAMLPAYAYHYLLSDVGSAHLQRLSPGSADRNRTLSHGRLSKLPVPVVTLGEQTRITEHLGRLPHAHPAQSRSGVDDHLLNSAIAEGEAGSPAALGEVLRPERRWISEISDEAVEPIGVKSFGRGLIRYPATPSSELSKMRYFTVYSDRLIVSNIKAWEGAVALSRASDQGRIGSNRFLQYSISASSVRLEWVHAYLASPAGVEKLSAASPGSADRNRTLSISAFESIEIPVPDLSFQDHIASLVAHSGRAESLRRRRDELAAAVLPAARNEIFNAMR